MAIYYVDGNSGNNSTGGGSSEKPWKTLEKARSTVKPGDEVRIRTATYKEALNLTVANVTWKADAGHKPIIDGGYHDGLFDSKGNLPHPPNGNYLPSGNGNSSLINISTSGIVIDGLIIRNSAGTGVGFASGADNCIVRNCTIDFHYTSCVKINPGATHCNNIIIENNVCTRASVRFFDPLRVMWGPEGVSGVMLIVRGRDCVVRNNICAYGYGEGINIDKGSYRTIIEGNVVHTCRHVHLYIMRSIDSVVRNNLVYHLFTTGFAKEGSAPSAIVIGDEKTSGSHPYSSGGQIYNNIVVNMGTLFWVRNNTTAYNTQLSNCYIGYNTFIGGDRTQVGIRLIGNQQGRPHQNSLFENNIVTGAPTISVANGDVSGIAFRNNLWEKAPNSAMRGPGDRIGEVNLVNPKAKINNPFPNPNSNIDPLNYQLTAKSTLAIGMASDGSTLNGVKPPAVAKDFFGATRDGKSDIGAHEFAGVATQLTANFTIGPGQEAGAVPHTVDFTDKSSGDRPIVSHVWDFGDGTTSTEVNPSHTYATASTFDVTLTVTDDQGHTDTHKEVALIAVSEIPNPILPDMFRRFVLVQSADNSVIAYGTQYPDMRCIVFWNSDPFHILNFDDIDDVEKSTLEAGKSALLWIDASDQNIPPISGDEPANEILGQHVMILA
jgi:PKD repeat protein